MLCMVLKAIPGEWQLCEDRQALNWIATADHCLVPRICGFTASLNGTTICLKSDLFGQIPVEPADIVETLIATLFGLFRFVRMEFGV